MVGAAGAALPPLRARAADGRPGPEAAVLPEAGSRVRRVLIGAPLPGSAFVKERMRKLVALPVLSADVLSSVAYAPEAMLAVLVLAGTAGLAYSLPVAAVVVFLTGAVRRAAASTGCPRPRCPSPRRSACC